MKMMAAVAVLLVMASGVFSYQLTASRDDMLSYYYSNIDAKVPKSAKMLLGDEKVNVYIGGSVLGIETRGGELYSFEKSPIDSPSITIKVSDDAADRISAKQEGVLAAIDNGGITITTSNWYSAFKVEIIKRLYAVAKIDDIVLGKKPSGTQSSATYNAAYVQRVRIENCLLWNC